jgi:hypothetical protein
LPERHRKAELFLPCFRFEEVTPDPFELFARKLARHVLLDDVVDRGVKLLRIPGFRQ